MTDDKNSPEPVAIPVSDSRPAAAGGASRGTKIVLAISLALNLAVAGVVAGDALDGGRHGERGMARDLAFGPFHEALSKEDRRALAKILIAKSPDMRDARKMMEADIAQILAALQSDPFDPAALDAAFAAQNARSSANFGVAQSAIRDFLVDMTPQARNAFALRLQKGMVDDKRD